MKYRVMVLPGFETMRPELLKKISFLVEKGGVILGNPPNRSPSMQNYPECDAEVKELADRLWAGIEGNFSKQVAVGKGKVYCNMSLEEVFGDINIYCNISLEEVFGDINITPDVIISEDLPVLWIHRSLPGMEIYFLTNQSDEKICFDAGFRITGKQPEWWNPVNGSIHALPEYHQVENNILVPVALEPYESGFVVFVNKARPSETNRNFADYSVVLEIDTEWEVDFTSPFNEGFTLTMDRLEDWSESENEQLTYFSGTAVYKTTFEFDALPGKNSFLKFEDLSAMAQITVNDQVTGGLWTAPWRVDVTETLKTGKNTIEIEVVNTWNNRLVKDESLKEGERKTWLTYNPFKPDTPLRKSGLIGPVVIEMVNE
jgi:hypothetical protein